MRNIRTLNPVRSWISRFPQSHQIAILEAIESGGLPQIRKLLRLIAELDPQFRGPIFNIEVLSTFNLEPLLPVLQFALNCLPSQAQIELGPLDDIEGQITKSSRSSARIDARVVVWRVEEVLPEVLYPFSCGFPEQVIARVDQLVARIDGLVSLHRRCSGGVPLFISTLSLPVHAGNTVLSAQHSAGLSASIARVNGHIYELATKTDGVYVLDLTSWAAFTGRSYADITVDLLARQPLSAKGQLEFAFFIARNLRPLIVPRRKVLALDLDNTLWGGVIGEEGLSGVILGHDFPGNVYLRIQRELLELRHRGILLVLLSKNNEADARQAFDSLPEMLLKWNDFVVRKVNWNPKHENLRAAATELGLGLDSFVLLDDSDYEREQIRQFLPEVLIMNDSSDALQTLRALWATDAFDSLVVSEEDRLRQHDYAQRESRDVSEHGDDLEAFLKSLEMEATVEEIGPSNLERVVSMLSKTNQFNLTTRRHSRAQVQSMLDRSGAIGLALRLRDKFGDQGIVALSIAVPEPEDGALVVDSFLVSCRALGRGVEDALWFALVNRALAKGARKLQTQFFPTAKNGPAAKFYDQLGLPCVERDSSAAYYRLEPIVPYPLPSWIALRNHNHEQ